MKVVSWNCRGLGQEKNKEALLKLIKTEKPQILLIQETKLKDDEVLKEIKQLWNPSEGVAISARGASGGSCTTYSTQIFKEEQREITNHWTMVKLNHLQLGITFICLQHLHAK
jgi:exonuclease III